MSGHSAKYWEKQSWKNFETCREYHLEIIDLKQKIENLEQNEIVREEYISELKNLVEDANGFAGQLQTKVEDLEEEYDEALDMVDELKAEIESLK